MAKARLDEDGAARPKTRIVHHPNPDHCVVPGMPLRRPEFEAEDGTRTPLGPPTRCVMRAVPYNEEGISHDDFMGDDAVEAAAGSTFEGLFERWIDVQARELGGTLKAHVDVLTLVESKVWTYAVEDEDWEVSGEELVEFVKEQIGSVPVGFWILEDLHYGAARIPLEDTCDHGGATIHAVAECSFMRICAKLAVRTVGDPTPAGVSVKKEGDGGAAGRLAEELREAEDGAEFEFRGHLLLVLDYEDDSDRQVKVSPHRDDVDRDAVWLFIDQHLTDELKSLEPAGTGGRR